MMNYGPIGRTFSPLRESWAGYPCLWWFNILFIFLFWLYAHQATFDYNLVSYVCLLGGSMLILPICMSLWTWQLLLLRKTCIGTWVLGTSLTGWPQSSPESYAPPTRTPPQPRSCLESGDRCVQLRPAPKTGTPTTTGCPGKLPEARPALPLLLAKSQPTIHCLCPDLKWRPVKVTCLLQLAAPS